MSGVCIGLFNLSGYSPSQQLSTKHCMQLFVLSSGDSTICRLNFSPITHFCWQTSNHLLKKSLKEYYEIVGESRPLSAFVPMRIFWQKCISTHETKQYSKFLSDPSPNCFTIDVWNINCWRQQFISYLSYCVFVSHFMAFYTSSVEFWDVIFLE